jgi:hypothetical protein
MKSVLRRLTFAVVCLSSALFAQNENAVLSRGPQPCFQREVPLGHVRCSRLAFRAGEKDAAWRGSGSDRGWMAGRHPAYYSFRPDFLTQLITRRPYQYRRRQWRHSRQIELCADGDRAERGSQPPRERPLNTSTPRLSCSRCPRLAMWGGTR